MKIRTPIQEQVTAFRLACINNGWTYRATDSVITISKRFTPGDMDTYNACDYAAYGILRLAPQSCPGSTWGTDSGSVGGCCGCKRGEYVLNKSGISKRFLAALGKGVEQCSN